MKINATGRARSTGRTTSKKAAQSGSAFTLQGQNQAQGAKSAALGASSPVVPIETLIALQEGDDFRRARKAATKRADQLLDSLAVVRLGLLEGRVPLNALHRLTATLQQNRTNTGDLRLEAVLDEIEVRAAVEKAKFDSSS